MLARHAESLFWMGRYMERAEDTARMLDVTYHGLLESPPEEASRSWLDLLSVLNVDQGFAKRHTEVTAAIVSEFLVLDEKNPGAIVSSVGRARENARSVRELISTELWEAVNMFWLELLARNLRADLEQQPYELYGLVKRRCQTVNGVAAETMPRDDGWRFLMLGWMLERTEMTCRLLNVRYGELAGATDLAGFHVLVGDAEVGFGVRGIPKGVRRGDGPGPRRRIPAAVPHVPAQCALLPPPDRARLGPAHSR